MAGNDELRTMVMAFRVSELQMLLGYAGRNKSGRKTELQSRALELLRLKSTPVQMKIRDLYKSIQHGLSNSQPGDNNQNSTSSTSSNFTVPDSTMNFKQCPSMMQGANNNPPDFSHYYQQQRSMYTPMPSPYLLPTPGTANSSSSGFPVHPDVKLKKLPFYELRAELLKPSTLVPFSGNRIQEQSFIFHLTPQQANDIAMNRDVGPGMKNDYVIQVQLRLCLLETSCEQDDAFPSGLVVKLNGKICQLPNPIPSNKPGQELRRPPRPLNITQLCKLSPTVGNHITVSWFAEFGTGFVVAVNLVKKLTSAQLLSKLKSRGVRHADYTTGLIKEKLCEDQEIATTSLKVSLLCPLGKVMMTTPCRASTCTHLQCFDASLYLQMNERKSTWICPVCDKPALYDNLVIDGYFQEVLQSSRLVPGQSDIQVHQDGSWSTIPLKKEGNKAIKHTKVKPESPPVVLDCDELEIVPVEDSPKKDEPKKKAIVVDLTLSDSDDDGKTDADVIPISDVCNTTPTKIERQRSPNIITLDSPSPPSTPPPASAVCTPLPTHPRSPSPALHTPSPTLRTPTSTPPPQSPPSSPDSTTTSMYSTLTPDFSLSSVFSDMDYETMSNLTRLPFPL